jgi:hypothetical protein
MYCSCKRTTKGYKGMPVELTLYRKRYRMRSCSQATGTWGISLLSVSGSALKALDGSMIVGDAANAKHFMVSVRMPLTSYCCPPDRTEKLVFTIGSYIQRLNTPFAHLQRAGSQFVVRAAQGRRMKALSMNRRAYVHRPEPKMSKESGTSSYHPK